MIEMHNIYPWIIVCLFLSRWTRTHKTRDEDSDPVGSVDFWPAGSVDVFPAGSDTFSPDPDPTCNNEHKKLSFP